MSKCLLKCLTFCLFPLLTRIAECFLPESLNAWKLQSLRESQNRRMFRNKNSFSCQSNLPFCVDEKRETQPKTYRGLPQASHGIRRNKKRTGNKWNTVEVTRSSLVFPPPKADRIEIYIFPWPLLYSRPFPSSLVPLFQSESKCETILMKITLICMKMKLHAEVIFRWKVSHLDSFWNGGTRELGNGLSKDYRMRSLAVYSLSYVKRWSTSLIQLEPGHRASAQTRATNLLLEHKRAWRSRETKNWACSDPQGSIRSIHDGGGGKGGEASVSYSPGHNQNWI